jgi:hypothetical protein
MASLASRWKEAEELDVQVKDKFKDYPDTLTSMGNLALTYRNQSRWEGGRKAGGASDGDEKEGARLRASRHAS